MRFKHFKDSVHRRSLIRLGELLKKGYDIHKIDFPTIEDVEGYIQMVEAVLYKPYYEKRT